MNSSQPGKLKAKAMTKTQLAALYGVCTRTFSKWIKPFSDEIGPLNETNIFTPAQVQVILDKIGEP